ncbi:LAGLIDADG family homing endonuclease [Bacillus niameyensis]|uniref:LAGLIDADG family homing endonuclease n=1 Tax=Bacillus niameyensis TaxID=1522308 RepID=UPI000A67CEB7|nr:LAGLIDADG family homing endonuclease [Bacillus niameyensis]
MIGGIKIKDWESAYLAGIVDGEGSVTLTRMHEGEHRRPCITISSTDIELLKYIQTLTNGYIITKKNYNPEKHKDSYTLSIKNKECVLIILRKISPYLRVDQKRMRALHIINNYEKVTPRNGKYNAESLKRKLLFEEEFFQF